MMADTLEIFGVEHAGVKGFQAQNENGDWVTYVPMDSEVIVADDGDVVCSLDPGKIYHFTGELTSLTISLNASNGLAHYLFDFNCGATAPTITLPSNVKLTGSIDFDSNRHCEVDILNDYGVVLSWVNS